ncbi:MAG: DUF4232 domain-containing protein [Acidimicrobiales bacterium]
MVRTYKIAAFVVLVLVVGVGAFFAGRETATTSSPASNSTSTTSTTSRSSKSTTTSSPTTTTAASAKCQLSQLTIAESGAGGAAGTEEHTYSLVNSSSTACTLYGYPGILLLGPGSAPEPTTVARGGGLSFESIAASTVKLVPGATAYFNVGTSDVTPPCSTSTAVEITPPTNTTHAVVASSVTACDNGTVHVSAVFGSTDSSATQTTAPPGP